MIYIQHCSEADIRSRKQTGVPISAHVWGILRAMRLYNWPFFQTKVFIGSMRNRLACCLPISHQNNNKMRSCSGVDKPVVFNADTKFIPGAITESGV